MGRGVGGYSVEEIVGRSTKRFRRSRNAVGISTCYAVGMIFYSKLTNRHSGVKCFQSHDDYLLLSVVVYGYV